MSNPKAISGIDRVAVKADPTEQPENLVFTVKQGKTPKDVNHRNQLVGSLDEAETITVLAYVPVDFGDTDFILSTDDLRPTPKGVRSWNNGRALRWEFEDKTRNILVLMTTPVNMAPVATIELQR